ncbi:MAG: hypothetical protein DI622_00205 [Chryseobacterium sp.]|uniref:hypothetical protein n=1 Tax=Chryseobacterium sp. TaxID=1871047 RepID=UPI000DB2A495|nr:hypothetical protein [Chryseobacterium sp.]MPS63290.1 hypothetical protein [Chryseobacterium sp.]PZU26697.1 MAG: hypothetical protein DI622_00205 [Chryseobacterium sp.]
MKKFFPLLLLAFVSLFIFSCDDNDNNDVPYQDNDTYPIMRDATGSFSSSNSFTLSMDISIQSSDVVLVYRKVGSYWQSVPKTYYLDDVQNLPTGRELDYNFNFNSSEVNISTAANFNQSTQMTSAETSQYLTNQTFRIVLVPASPAKGAAATVDYSDYNAVVKYYNLDESKVIKTKVN